MLLCLLVPSLVFYFLKSLTKAKLKAQSFKKVRTLYKHKTQTETLESYKEKVSIFAHLLITKTFISNRFNKATIL